MPCSRCSRLAAPFAVSTLLLASLPSRVLADTQATAPAGGGLPALVVRVDLARASVDAGGVAVPIQLTSDQMPAAGDVVVEAVAIGRDRHVVHVRVPAKGADPDGLAWEAILAASRPPMFAGLTGLVGGDPGERTGKAVQVVSNGPSSFVLVGDVREDLRICGQGVTLLDPLALYPASLELRTATVQRLSADRQKAARDLVATDKGASADPALARLLVAKGSSVPGSPLGAELTDRDPTTTWTEQRPGIGQGEFVVMAAPRDVPIPRMQVVLTPPSPAGSVAAPKTFYLVTNTKTFRVTVPDDAWNKPGRAYEITFPEPLEASCVALVLDTAYARGQAHPDVGVAELVAYSEFDRTGATLDEVAQRLTGERGSAAAQVLERAGEGALAAVARAYDGLDPRGRALAMDVAASHERCEEAVPVLARGLCEADGQAPRKAREKLDRCKEAAPTLAQLLRDDAAHRACVAPVLATIAPEQALGPIASALGSTPEADHATRAALRGAFALALKVAPATRLGEILSDAGLDGAARLEVMRAAGSRVTDAVAASEVAMAELLRGSPSVRTRYLVLGPLGELARAGDRAASARIADTIAHDPEWPVRERAAELGAGLPEALGPLVAAAKDAEPRVREAAFAALAPTPNLEGVTVAVGALARDRWSFVRVQAAGVLMGAAPSRDVDDALGDALHDPSARVRGTSLVALARRRAVSWRDGIRERLDDRDEDADVRKEAAWALGAICDAKSVDRLTQLARALAEPGTDEDARQLGLSALIGLAAMQPRDLKDRIAPLMAKTSPPSVRVAAERALAARSVCAH